MQRAAEAFVMCLGGRIRHDAIRVIKLPTKRDYAALHTITRLLAHKALMITSFTFLTEEFSFGGCRQANAL